MDGAGGQPIEYWRASDTLAPFVSGYHRYRVALPPGVRMQDALFPSWATIRIAVTGSREWSLRIGSHAFDPVPHAAFVGPTSHAGYVDTNGGTLVGVGLLPLGWATLFGGDASRFANRVVPLETVAPECRTIQDALAAGMPVDAAFEQWLVNRIGRRAPDARIARIFAMLDDPAVSRIETIAEELGMTQRVLADFTRLHFGFTPKLLLRRSRFLRALSAVLTRPAEGAAVLDAAGYWDRSHFLRDSHLFLGCSIRDFVKRRGPLNQIALTVRSDVIGAPV